MLAAARSRPLSQQAKATHRGRAVPERRGMWREKLKKEGSVSDRQKYRKKNWEGVVFEAVSLFFECESACLSPSIFVVLCGLSEGWKEG